MTKKNNYETTEIIQRTANESNTFARQIKKNLTINELRVLFYTIAQIDSRRELEPGEQEVVNISIKDYWETLTVAAATREGQEVAPNYQKGGKLYQDIKESAKSLVSSTSFVEDDGKHYKITNIIESVDVDKQVGNIEIKFTVSGTKLFHPEDGVAFSKIKLLQVLKLTFAPAINLYEFCYSYVGEMTDHNIVEVKAEELRYILGTTYLKTVGRGKEEEVIEYPLWKDFNKFVLKRAVDEVSRQTDLIIKAESKKTGRNVTSVKFDIRRKPKYGSVKSVIPGQVTIDDLKPEIEVIGKPVKRNIQKRDFGFHQRGDEFTPEEKERYNQLDNKVLLGGELTDEEREEYKELNRIYNFGRFKRG